MTNKFATYKQSLALKELGFDEPCVGYYDEDNYLFTVREQDDIDDEWLAAPLKQDVFKWFREKFDLNYVIVKAESWFFTINGVNTQEGYKTYEEAEYACIDKLIEIAKES